MKKMGRTLLIVALALTLCVTVCVASIVSFADEVTVTVIQNDGTNVVIGEGQNTLSDDDGVITFDKENKILTLSGVDAKKIEINGTLTVVLEGENTLTTDGEGALDVVTGDLTVNGTGTLTLSAAHSTIYVRDGSYIQTGATVKPTATTGNSDKFGYVLNVKNDLTVSAGTLTATTSLNYGVVASGVISVSGGTVSSSSIANAFQGAGIDISGGIVSATSTSSDSGLRASGKEGIKISAGEVTVSTKGASIYAPNGGDIVISGGTLTVNGTSNTIWAKNGSVYLKGGKITVNGTGYAVRVGTGDIFVSGGEIELNQPNNAQLLRSESGDVTISGGTLIGKCTSNGIVAAAGAVTVTGGRTTITGSSSELVRAYGGPFTMKGGYLEVSGTTNLIITANSNNVNISGGTLKLTASTGGCINASGNINISEGNDPQLILNSPSYAMRLNTGSTSFSMTDGTISGSAKHFLYVKDTKCSFNMGADVALDFTVSDAFFSNAAPKFTLASGIVWEEGKALTASTSAASVKSTLDGKYIFIDSVEELLLIGSDEAYPLDGSYRLTTDLDLSEIEWKPLGALSGTFDGRGHIIHNMHLGTKDTPYDYGTTAYSWGMFSSLTGTVKNLGFKDVYFHVTGTSTSNAAVGTVCAYIQAGGLVDNVAVLSGTLKGTLKHQLGMGGIAGGTGSSTTGWVISNCYNNADITAITTTNNSGSYAVAAGIIARAWNKSGNTVKNCFNAGNITAIDNGSKATTYSLAGNIISAQGQSNTTGTRAITRSNNYAVTNNLFFEGTPAGILQDDLNKTTLVDPLGALNPSVSFSGLGSKWVVKTADGNDYYPILAPFENYAEPVIITDELVAEVTAKVEAALDGLMVTNNLVPTDVTSKFTEFAPTAKATLTLVEKADLDKAGSWELVVTLSNGSEIKRTLVIDQLPNVKDIDYDFTYNVAGIGQGTVTVTLNKDAVAGKYVKALYWGDEDGILEGYSALAIDSVISCVDDILVFNTPERLYIPVDATRVYVTLDGIVAGSYEIPASRKLTLSAQKYAFGVTSDTHHYSSSNPATAQKFATVLGFMENKGADFMVVTGDVTNNGTAVQWANFNEHYAAGGFTIPVWACTGNHDAIDWNIDDSLTPEQAIQNMYNGLDTYAKEDYTQDKNGKQYKVTVSDVNPMYDYTVQFEDDLFVYLGIGAYYSNHHKADGSETNSSQHLKLDQIEWLDQVLADWYNTSDNYGNVYLMFHYTPWEHGLWNGSSLKIGSSGMGELTGRSWSKKVDGFMTEWNSSELLYNVLAKYPNLIHFGGHAHTSLASYRTISATRHWKLVDDSGDTVFYEVVNTPLGYTAINGSSSQNYEGFYVSVHEEGILITGYNADTGDVQSHATFFIPNELNDETRVRINDGMIQYVKGYGEWQKLVDVSKLSDNEIEVQLTETYVQWREVGAETWIDLIAIEDIDGEMVFDTDVTLFATVNGKDADVQLIDQDGNVIETVTSVNGVVNFTTLKLEEGTYTFTVKQNAQNANGWTYDASEKTITVTVADGVATVEGEAIFTNTYDAVVDTDVTINVNVKVEDITMKEGYVNVTLTKDGETIATAVVDASGKAVLTIPASKDMAGIYTITATATFNGINLSDAQIVTVTVADDGDGVANVTASASEVSFSGIYIIPFQEGEIKDGKYLVNGKGKEMGLFKHTDGHYYYAGPNGKLVVDQKYFAWRTNENCDLPEGNYFFDVDGKLYQGIYMHPEKGDLFFFENGKVKEKGLFKYTDGNYYFSQYNGKIVTSKNYTEYGEGKFYVWKFDESAADIAEGWYFFDENGAMLQGIQMHPEKNDLYYFVNGKVKEMGLFQYTDGKYYFSQYNGKIVTSKNYTEYGEGKFYVWKFHETAPAIKADWYFFGEDGAMLQGIHMHPEKNDLYYFENGKVKDIGFFQYTDGNYYCTKAGGKIIAAGVENEYGTTGKYYVYKFHESANGLAKGWYFFDETGKMRFYNDTVYTINVNTGVADYDKLAYGSEMEFNGGIYKTFDFDGVVNTSVFAYNNTASDMYARTIFLVEDNQGMSDELHINFDEDDFFSFKLDNVELNGNSYEVYVYDYNATIAAGETSRLSAYQYFWDATVTEEWIAKGGDDGCQIKFINQLSADGSFEAITAEYVAKLFK